MNEYAMMECIRQEPDVIREILEHKEQYTKEFVQHFKQHDVKRIYLSGHGSPYNVGGALRIMMEQLLKVEVSVDYPSLFNNHLSFNANGRYANDEMLLICPAQSGRTTGPVIAAKHAKGLGIPVICTTLIDDGVLAQECDIVLCKQSGDEESFPETKGHIASLMILMLCVIESAYALQHIDEGQYKNYMEGLKALPSALDSTITASTAWYEKNKEILVNAPYLTFIGYGENYATAIEGSLKILETTLKPCLSYECEEYMHGQNQPVDKDSVIFMIANRGEELHRIQRLAAWCRKKGAHVILVSDDKTGEVSEDDIIISSTLTPYLSVIEYLIPFQVLGFYIAKDMGLSSVVAHHDDAGKELGVRYE